MLMLAMMMAQAEPAECRAGPAEVLVGERYRRGVPSRAKALSGARAVRVQWPGTAMTMDYRVDRLNLRVDRRRRITAVSCG